MHKSDASLVREALKGDAAAFGELYDRFARLVRAICYDTTGNVNEAQDLAQEVFLRVHAKLGALHDPERFGPWLVTVTRNVCREYRRKCARDRHIMVGLAPEEPITGKAEPDQTEQQLVVMRQAMERLGEQERLALHVYYLQQQDVQQACKVLGVSRSGFYRLLNKAKKKMQKFMEKA